MGISPEEGGWIIMTVVEGDLPEDMVGPFPTREAAEAWGDENEAYLVSMIESALDNWMGDPGEIKPTALTLTVFVNSPQYLAAARAAQERELAE